MGYHVVDPTSLDPTPDRPCVQRTVGEAAGLENVAVNLYEVAPGERIPLAYHYHDEQEEIFHVLDGRLHVETPDGDHRVPAGHCFVAEPGSPHLASNPAAADEVARVLAVGAPAVDDVHAYEP